MPLAQSGSYMSMVKELGGEAPKRAWNLPRSSRLRFPYISEDVVQQYGTLAFGPSSTRRKIYIAFEIMGKHAAQLMPV